MALFSPPKPIDASTKDGALAASLAQLDQASSMAMAGLLNAYKRARLLVNASPFKPGGTQLTSADVYGALDQRNAGDAAKLQFAARLTKTVINAIAPGTIVDDVPEVTITP